MLEEGQRKRSRDKVVPNKDSRSPLVLDWEDDSAQLVEELKRSVCVPGRYVMSKDVAGLQSEEHQNRKRTVVTIWMGLGRLKNKYGLLIFQ